MPANSWLSEYAAFHRAHRHDAHARFVMFSCHEKMSGAGSVCGGHGNRFRQIVWTLRVAAGARRVLLVDWASPERLEDYLEPAADIDWRLTKAERALLAAPNHSHVYRMNWPNVTGLPPDTKYLRVTAGCHDAGPCYNCSDLVVNFGLAYRYLFRPTTAFHRTLHQRRLDLFGSSTSAEHVRYNSMHVRMGDSAEGSQMRSNFNSPIRDVRSTLLEAAIGIWCVASATPSKHPLFVATDNAALKEALAARDPALINASGLLGRDAFRRVVVTGCVDCMVNAVQKHNFSAEGVAAIFVDAGLLAGGADFAFMGKGSNYATWVKGWRHADLSGADDRPSFSFPSSLHLAPSASRQAARHACTSWLEKEVARPPAPHLLRNVTAWE